MSFLILWARPTLLEDYHAGNMLPGYGCAIPYSQCVCVGKYRHQDHLGKCEHAASNEGKLLWAGTTGHLLLQAAPMHGAHLHGMNDQKAQPLRLCCLSDSPPKAVGPAETTS